MSGMYFDDARGLRQALVISQLARVTVSHKLPSTSSGDTHRKKNRKWKLLQPYLPYLGWGLLTLVTVVLACREHRLSNISQSLQTATQELKELQTQQTQLQVCGGRTACRRVSNSPCLLVHHLYSVGIVAANMVHQCNPHLVML